MSAIVTRQSLNLREELSRISKDPLEASDIGFRVQPYSATAGKLDLLATVNAVGASTVDFDGYFTTGYDQYIIISDSIYVSTTLDLLARVYVGGVVQTSANYDSSSHYRISNASTHTVASGTAATFIELTRTINPVTTKTINMNLSIKDPLQVATKKLIVCDTQALDSSTGGSEYENHIGSYMADNSAISGIQILPSTGAITGDFYLYGVRNA